MVLHISSQLHIYLPQLHFLLTQEEAENHGYRMEFELNLVTILVDGRVSLNHSSGTLLGLQTILHLVMSLDRGMILVNINI